MVPWLKLRGGVRRLLLRPKYVKPSDRWFGDIVNAK